MSAHTHIHKQSSHQCIQIQWLEQSHSHQLVFDYLLRGDKALWASNEPFVVWSEKQNVPFASPLPFDYFSNHLKYFTWQGFTGLPTVMTHPS